MSYDLWGRLRYMLSPQFDIYEKVADVVFGYVADVGCGTGFGTHLLSRNADMVLGYEIDPTAKAFADRAFSNGNIKFVEDDITRLALPPAPFDFVVMIDVIEHIMDAPTALGCCASILKESGTFVCSTPNRLSRYRKSDYHVREYSPDELKELLAQKFDRVEIVDFELEPKKSDYINPILAICQ